MNAAAVGGLGTRLVIAAADADVSMNGRQVNDPTTENAVQRVHY
jgi:hypothetical protein